MEKENEKSEEKKERVKVRTMHAVYTGDLFIPEMRNRFSDVINAPEIIFINLTDVYEDQSREEIEHLSINKSFIESIRKAD